MKSHSKSQATIRRDEQAKARLAARNSRTDEQQLRLLIDRGAGHCEEANRLRARITGAPLVSELGDGEEWTEASSTPKKTRPQRKRRNVPASLM